MTRLEFVDDSITTVESGGPELSVCAIILDSSPTDIIVASLQFADDTATGNELILEMLLNIDLKGA